MYPLHCSSLPLPVAGSSVARAVTSLTPFHTRVKGLTLLQYLRVHLLNPCCPPLPTFAVKPCPGR